MLARSLLPLGYNLSFTSQPISMDAEQINQIAGTLSGLRARTADLRRYL